MMLDHYQRTKNLLVSYSPKKLASSRDVEATTRLAARFGERGAALLVVDGAPA
jgi:hypothetical protein